MKNILIVSATRKNNYKLAKNIEAGVLPVPPMYKFPKQIVGVLNFIGLINFFFKIIYNSAIKVSGNKSKVYMLYLVSQNLGLLRFIK